MRFFMHVASVIEVTFSEAIRIPEGKPPAYLPFRPLNFLFSCDHLFTRNTSSTSSALLCNPFLFV